MTKIINLTPHTVHILDESNNLVMAIESSGVARCSVERRREGDVMGIPINRTAFGEVSDLPEPVADTVYIVSALTAQAVPERSDVLITDDAVRDDQGRIIGCRALAHI